MKNKYTNIEDFNNQPQDFIPEENNIYQIDWNEGEQPVEDLSSISKIFFMMLDNLERKFSTQNDIANAVNEHFSGKVITQSSISKVFAQLPINIKYRDHYYILSKNFNYYIMIKTERTVRVKRNDKKIGITPSFAVNKQTLEALSPMIDKTAYCRMSEHAIIIRSADNNVYYSLINELKNTFPEEIVFDIVPESGERNIKILLNSAYGDYPKEYLKEFIKIMY